MLKRERRLKGYKKFFFSRPSKEDESIEDFIHRNLGEITQIDRNCGRRVEFLEDLIKSGISQGEIRASVDPMIAARMVIGLIESCAEQMYLFNRADKSVPKQQEQLFAFLQQALKS